MKIIRRRAKEYSFDMWGKPKTKTIKMTNLKKYLNGFYWYDESNEELFNRTPTPVYDVEYPSTYQTHFGVCPVVFLRISDKVLPISNFRSMEKYVISEGFDIDECGYESFKYIHHDKKIVFTGNAFIDKPADEEEDDEENAGYITSDNDNEHMYISILPTIENKKFIEKFMKKIHKFLTDTSKQVDKFYLIAQNQQGLFTQKTKFKSIPIKDDRYDLFYGKKFPHDKIKRFVEEDTENLMLLHGDPGTGKSNYIKHIITNSKKKVIYIAPSMLSVISSPQFVTFMMKNQNSILLIEDAEEVLSVDRNSATNNLLGLTDGFLKDSLGLKVIATFNCDIGKIDPALMRKGRMFLEYKFAELSVDECEELSSFMGMDRVIDKPMTLAEFFNEEDNHVESNSFETRRIGFV
jgi:hypothetical protein